MNDMMNIKKMPYNDKYENLINPAGKKLTSYLKNKTIFTKLMIVIIFTAISYCFSNYNLSLISLDNNCIFDQVFALTDSINFYFNENKTPKFVLLIISSLLMDILALTVFYQWTFYGKSIRPLITFFMFYGVRGNIQQIFQMGFPPGFIFEYPGFYSICVPYLQANDFFFSGHVGMPIIAASEFKKSGYFSLQIICYFISAIEAFTMLTLRAHYSIDIITGIIFSLLCCFICSRFAPFIDEFLVFCYKKINKRETIVDKL